MWSTEVLSVDILFSIRLCQRMQPGCETASKNLLEGIDPGTYSFEFGTYSIDLVSQTQNHMDVSKPTPVVKCVYVCWDGWV